MENRTTRIQNLIKDRQDALKSQKELLEKFAKQSIDTSKRPENDVDRIVNNILSEKGLSDSLLSGNEEQFNKMNLTAVNELINDVPDNDILLSGSSFKKSIGAVDVNIVETAKDTFDKGIQADISSNNLTTGFLDTNINLKTQNIVGSNKLLSLSIPTSPTGRTTTEGEITVSGPNQKFENIKQDRVSPSRNTNENELNNNEILKSSEFMDFFSRASRLVERALGEGAIFDPFFNINNEIDTSTIKEEDKSVKNPGNISLSTSNGILRNSMIFHHESISNRPVMSIKSHPNFPEYFIVAYGTKFPQNSSFESMNQNSISSSLLEYGGCVLLWSISTPKNPENIFVASCSVLTVAFDPYCQYRYVGTSYNGEILIWDSRNGKIPCQKSNSISINDAEGNNSSNHSFPIYCMELLGSKGSQSIVTIDIDGKLCNWNLTNLSEPVESFQLRKSNSKDISVQCMTLSKLINPNAIICGSEDGSLYQTIIKTNKPGTITSTFQNAHNGFITCLDYHPINDCFLSSGADWTIKLWIPNPLANSFTLLYTFESSENYVIGVAWHPIHPGIFAAIDADSRLIIYDLTNSNYQTPSCKIDTSSQSNNHNSGFSDIPTCISWSNDGVRLFIGYINGDIIMCNVDSKIYQPSRNVWDLFNQEIENFKNSNNLDSSVIPTEDGKVDSNKNDED